MILVAPINYNIALAQYFLFSPRVYPEVRHRPYRILEQF